MRETCAARAATGLAVRLGPPLGAYLLARAAFAAVAALEGLPPFAPETLLRWDSEHYLAIAARGYELARCAGIPGYLGSEWCGNTGWLPAYPLAIRFLAALGADPAAAGVALSAAAHLATLVLLWDGWLGPELRARPLLCLGLAAFFPGAIYQHAIFPVSACVLLLLAAALLLRRGRLAPAAGAGALAAFSYPTAILFGGAAALHLLLERRPWRERIGRALLVAAGTALGFGAALAYQRASVGAWDAFFRVSGKYGLGLHFPAATILEKVRPALAGEWEGGGLAGLQTAFVAALALALAGGALREGSLREEDRLPLLYLAAFWLVPLALGGDLSLYRAEALLLPAAVLARRLPTALLGGLVAAAAALALAMATLFERGVLI